MQRSPVHVFLTGQGSVTAALQLVPPGLRTLLPYGFSSVRLQASPGIFRLVEWHVGHGKVQNKVGLGRTVMAPSLQVRLEKGDLWD